MKLSNLLLKLIYQHNYIFGEKPVSICLTKFQYQNLKKECNENFNQYVIPNALLDFDKFNGVKLEVKG
jgi:hypothetical protein